MQYRYFRGLVLLAALGLLVGTPDMYLRMTRGLNPVAFGSYVPWGLWVAFYLFFLGLSAGAFLVTMLTYVLNWKRFESVGPLAAFTVLVALVCEVQFIVYDLGTMHRAFYQFFLTPNFASLMTWMFVLFNAMLLLYLFKTYFLIRGSLILRASREDTKAARLYRWLALGRREYSEADRSRDEKRVHQLAWASLPVGLLFYATNGAFFAILMNRPIWNSALTPLLFVVAALLSGGALIAFLTYVFYRESSATGDFCVQEDLCLDLGRVVLFLLIVFLALEGMQFFVGYQTARTDIVTSLNQIVKGPHWWTFWIIHLFLGSLIPIILFVGFPHRVKATVWACFLIFVTFPAVRYNFIVPDLAVYKLEGLGQAFVHFRLSTDYVPNLNEWMVSVWIISFGFMMFLLGTRYLPIIVQEQGESHV